MKYLTEEEIYTKLKYLETLLNKKDSLEFDVEIAKHLLELSAENATASYVMASAMYNYQSKKTPASVALRDWTKEICSNFGKKITAMQSLLSLAKTEKINSKFQ